MRLLLCLAPVLLTACFPKGDGCTNEVFCTDGSGSSSQPPPPPVGGVIGETPFDLEAKLYPTALHGVQKFYGGAPSPKLYEATESETGNAYRAIADGTAGAFVVLDLGSIALVPAFDGYVYRPQAPGAAVLADATTELKVQLFASDGTRLVDDTLDAKLDGQPAMHSNKWDDLAFSSVPAGEYVVALTGGSFAAAARHPLSVVDAIDSIALTPETGAWPTTPGQLRVCAFGFAGSQEVASRYYLDVKGGSVLAAPLANCYDVTLAAGDNTITAHRGDITATVTISL